MKKIMILACVILSLAPVVLLSCATTPVKPLSRSDLPDLKGNWEGSYGAGGFNQPIELKISNEALEGEITFHGTPEGTVRVPFNGKLENGRLVSSWGKDRWIRLNFRKGEGNMKLEGDYQWQQWGGTLSLKKIG